MDHLKQYHFWVEIVEYMYHHKPNHTPNPRNHLSPQQYPTHKTITKTYELTIHNSTNKTIEENTIPKPFITNLENHSWDYKKNPLKNNRQIISIAIHKPPFYDNKIYHQKFTHK